MSTANTFKSLMPLFKERYAKENKEVPIKSKAQLRFLHAAAAGKSDKMSKKDAEKYLRDSPKKNALKKLPEYVSKKRK